MKFIVFPFIVFIYSCSHKLIPKVNKEQISYFDVSVLLPETIEIMDSLGIQIRENIIKDGKIKTTVSDSNNVGDKRNFGYFDPYIAITTNEDKAKRFYPNPVVRISHDIDSILTESRDTSLFYEIIAKSIIVHELAHYLQRTFYQYVGVNKRYLSKKEYISIPTELEAYAVASYYFFKHRSPDILKQIMIYVSQRPLEEQWKILIDAYQTKVNGIDGVFYRNLIIW